MLVTGGGGERDSINFLLITQIAIISLLIINLDLYQLDDCQE